MLHQYRLGLSGKLLREKPTISTLLMKARTPGSGYSTFNRFPGITPPLKQEPDFQFDDADVAKSWSKLQLDLVDEIPPPMVAQLLMDAKDVLGWFPQVQCAIRSQAQRTETRVALLWQIWRSRRIPIHLGQGVLHCSAKLKMYSCLSSIVLQTKHASRLAQTAPIRSCMMTFGRRYYMEAPVLGLLQSDLERSTSWLHGHTMPKQY